MRIDENEEINIWLAGNTGLRNPMRIQEGFIAFSQSPYVGNLHGNEMGFMRFLDDKGIISNEAGRGNIIITNVAFYKCALIQSRNRS